MSSAGSRRIKVIGPVKGEGEEGKEVIRNQRASKALILGGKKYCPNDSSLLVYRPDTDTSLCTFCGFIDGEEGQQQQQQQQGEESSRSTISENIQSSTDSFNNITMNISPMNQQPRSIMSKQKEDFDPEIQALQEKGYVIIDSQTTVSEEGTYNAERAMKDKERMFSRNRDSSWAVY